MDILNWSLACTALFRPLFCVPLSLLGLYEPKWRGPRYFDQCVLFIRGKLKSSTLADEADNVGSKSIEMSSIF